MENHESWKLDLEKASQEASRLFVEIYEKLETRKVDPGVDFNALVEIFRESLNGEGVALLEAREATLSRLCSLARNRRTANADCIGDCGLGRCPVRDGSLRRENLAEIQLEFGATLNSLPRTAGSETLAVRAHGRRGGYSTSSRSPNNFRSGSRKPDRTSPPVSVCFSVRTIGLAEEV